MKWLVSLILRPNKIKLFINEKGKPQLHIIGVNGKKLYVSEDFESKQAAIDTAKMTVARRLVFEE